MNIADELKTLASHLCEAEKIATEIMDAHHAAAASGDADSDSHYNRFLRVESIQLRIAAIREQVENLQ